MLRSARPVAPTQHDVFVAISSPLAPRNPSHQRTMVGNSAIGRSLVTFFGIKKNIVVQAGCGHLPHCSTFSKNSIINPHVSFDNSSETLMGENHHIPHPSLSCNSSLLVQDLLSSTSAALPSKLFVFQILHLRVPQCLAHSCLFFLTPVEKSDISPKHSHSSSRSSGFRDSM